MLLDDYEIELAAVHRSLEEERNANALLRERRDNAPSSSTSSPSSHRLHDAADTTPAAPQAPFSRTESTQSARAFATEGLRRRLWQIGNEPPSPMPPPPSASAAVPIEHTTAATTKRAFPSSSPNPVARPALLASLLPEDYVIVERCEVDKEDGLTTARGGGLSTAEDKRALPPPPASTSRSSCPTGATTNSDEDGSAGGSPVGAVGSGSSSNSVFVLVGHPSVAAAHHTTAGASWSSNGRRQAAGTASSLQPTQRTVRFLDAASLGSTSPLEAATAATNSSSSMPTLAKILYEDCCRGLSAGTKGVSESLKVARQWEQRVTSGSQAVLASDLVAKLEGARGHLDGCGARIRATLWQFCSRSELLSAGITSARSLRIVSPPAATGGGGALPASTTTLPATRTRSVSPPEPVLLSTS